MTVPGGPDPPDPPDALDPLDPREAEIDSALAELRQALEGLRSEIRSRFPAPLDRGVRASIDWERLWTQLRRRVSTFGMTECSVEVDEFGMDVAVLDQTRPLLDLLYERWWRVEMKGAQWLPETGPSLLVANRAGLLPYDGLMLAHGLARELPAARQPRFLVADGLMTLPFVQPQLARIGGVRACRENALRLLRGGHTVLAFPEGAKGAAKVFRQRYRLQRFARGGAVRLALEARVPLLPVGIVGAEEVQPVLLKPTFPARRVGLPFLPVTPTFPWLGPLGLAPLPSKWVILIGEPLATEHLEPAAADDELLVSRLNEELRGRIQILVDMALHERRSVWA